MINFSTIKRIPPLLIIFGAVIIFFGKKIIPSESEFLGGFDVANYFYWNAHFIREQFLSGQIPLWNPHYYCGHPFIANPQTFVFYPATLLFVILPLSLAFTLDTLLHFMLAAAGMYYFVLLLTDSKAGAIISAVTYALNAYFGAKQFAGHLTAIHTAALVPWIFFCVEKGFREKTIRSFVIGGVVFGCQILGGEPQNNYYTLLFLCFYILYRLIVDYRINQLKHTRLLVFSSICFALTAFSISAVQVFPALEFMRLSDRSQGSYVFSTFGSLPPADLFKFLVSGAQSPFITKQFEFTGYFGIIPFFLAGFGLVFSKNHYSARCFAAFAVFALTLMLGGGTPLYEFYFHWLPGISLFRVPARALFFFVFSISILTGYGTQAIYRLTLSKKHYWALNVITVFTFIAIVTCAALFQVPFFSRAMILSYLMILASLIIFNFIFRLDKRWISCFVLLVVIFFDLYMSNSKYISTLNQQVFSQKIEIEKKISNKDAPGYYRVSLPETMSLRGAKFNYHSINGYSPIVLDDYFRFVHEMAGISIDQNLRSFISRVLLLNEYDFLPKFLGVKYAALQTKKNNLTLIGYKSEQVIPKALLVYKSLLMPSFEDHFQYMKSHADFDPRQTILLTPGPESPFEKVFHHNDNDAIPDEELVLIEEYKPNQIELKTFSKRASYLLLNELYYPGWRAYVDGREVEILRADYLFRAIRLEVGAHRIRFVYRPMWFYAGAAISSIASILICFLLITTRPVRTKNLLY